DVEPGLARRESDRLRRASDFPADQSLQCCICPPDALRKWLQDFAGRQWFSWSDRPRKAAGPTSPPLGGITLKAAFSHGFRRCHQRISGDMEREKFQLFSFQAWRRKPGWLLKSLLIIERLTTIPN